MLKVYHDDNMRIVAALEEEASPNEYADLNIVYCTSDMLDVVYRTEHEDFPDSEEDGVSRLVRNGMVFPLSNIVKLKAIATYTVDVWRKKQQAVGYHNELMDRDYSTTEQSRTNLMGKLQEITLLQSESGIFPDITGAPVYHTKQQLEDVGIGMVQHIESVYTAAMSKVAEINSDTVTDAEALTAILEDVQQDLKG